MHWHRFSTFYHKVPGGDNYKEAEDLMRFSVKPTTLKDKVETFTIDIAHNDMDRAKLLMSWENTQVGFEIEAPVNEKIEAMIEQTLNPGGTQYYRAASYYHEAGKELETALEYIDIALEKYQAAGWKPYWVGRRKALILADLGKTKDAIKAAEQSTEWAKAEGADNYVKMNNASIAEWKKK
jgi:tetratricopeptide (TPR) repeat protein